MKIMLPAAIFVAVCALDVRAQEPEPEIPDAAQVAEDVAALRRELQEVEQQIRTLEERLVDLEQKRIILEDRLAEREDVPEAVGALNALKAESKERLLAYEAEIDELREREADDEEPVGLAWRDYAKHRREHLEKATDLDRRIQQIEGVGSIGKADDLLWDLDKLDTRWWMVSEPRYGRAMELEEMENAALATDDRTLFAAIRKAREMHAEDIEQGEELYEVWLKRAESERAIGELMTAFWERIDDIAAEEDADEQPE